MPLPRSALKTSTQLSTGLNNSPGSSTSRIRVVIRVRPLSTGESKQGHKCTVERRNDQQFTVWDPAVFEFSNHDAFSEMDPSCWSRSFTFDDCLWSMDKNDDCYASQDTVYERVAEPLVGMIMDGFNCCVFAYGQTGAGKTKTMMGDIARNPNPAEFGMIPRICYGLFDTLEKKSNNNTNSGGVEMETVHYSHIEIYNENVRDLLAGSKSAFLKVREHPKKGVFIANLTTVHVKSFEEVMSFIDIGERNRTVAATNVNLHSSRSHAIVTLTVQQRVRNSSKHGLPTSGLQEKVARLHMVDLAGSERAASSGNSSIRLREANNINKSLSVLGDVIKCLGESKSRRGHIPYRNSVLTNILRDSLGGNSHVVFIAAISPSTSDYDETISTLKFAERAKRVKLKVEANVTTGLQSSNFSPDMVPLLQAEVNKLRQLLAQQQKSNQQAEDLEAASERSIPRVRFADEETQQLQNEHRSQVIEMQQRVQELELELERREKLIQDLSRERSRKNRQTLSRSGSIDSSAAMTNGESYMESDDGNSPSTYQISPNTIGGAGVGEDEFNEREVEIGSRPIIATTNTNDFTATSGVKTEGRRDRTPEVTPVEYKNTKSLLSSSSSFLNSSPPRTIHDLIKTPRGEIDVGTPTSASASGSLSLSNISLKSSPPRNQPVVLLSEDVVDISQPRVINLNQDPLFSECLVYYIPEGNVTAGGDENDSDILLSGPDILPQHCVFKNDGEDVVIEPLEDAQIFVNGDLIRSHNISGAPVILSHCDRISLGRFHLFRYEAPGRVRPKTPTKSASASSSISDAANTDVSISSDVVATDMIDVPDWEFAQAELLSKNQSFLLRGVGKDEELLSNNNSNNNDSNNYKSPIITTVNGSGNAQQSLSIPSSASASSIVSDRSTLSTSTMTSTEKLIKTRDSTSINTSITTDDTTTSSSTNLGYKASPAKTVSSTVSSLKSNNSDFWQRLTQVAEGNECADPSELREMLRLLVNKAESQMSNRSGNIFPATSSSTIRSGGSNVSDCSIQLNDSIVVNTRSANTSPIDPSLAGSTSVSRSSIAIGTSPATTTSNTIIPTPTAMVNMEKRYKERDINGEMEKENDNSITSTGSVNSFGVTTTIATASGLKRKPFTNSIGLGLGRRPTIPALHEGATTTTNGTNGNIDGNTLKTVGFQSSYSKVKVDSLSMASMKTPSGFSSSRSSSSSNNNSDSNSNSSGMNTKSNSKDPTSFDTSADVNKSSSIVNANTDIDDTSSFTDSTATSTVDSSGNPRKANFELEAQALEQELEQMQRTLKSRVARYYEITN